jgi:hypothetical protein
MNLQPGCRFVVAPHFHLPAEWPRRLSVGAGMEEVDGDFFPHPSWRPPTTDELAVLLRTSAEPASPEELDACVCLFQLPRHLQSAWWHLLEHAAGALGEGRLPGFDAFVSQLVEFLGFKELPVPEGARCDAVVSQPRERFACKGAQGNRPVGLLRALAQGAPRPGAEGSGCQRLWGGINLGDEQTSVVLLNLPTRQMEVDLRRRFPDQLSPASPSELVEPFLRCCPDYPMVRLILGPGEGYRLPQGGLVLAAHLAEGQQPNVLLLISQGRAHCA